MSKDRRPPRPPRRAEPPAQAPIARMLETIRDVLDAETGEFRALAKAAALDPKVDFRNVELNGVPLADQDLSGFDFTGADLRDTGVERAKYNASTIFASARFSGRSLDPRVQAFNQKLRSLPFDGVEAALNDKLQNRRFADIDVASFTAAIRKAPDEKRARHWFGQMVSIGVRPDVIAFSALIAKAASEQRAAEWYDEMRHAGVTPNAITFSTLMDKAESEDHAERWFHAMGEQGIAPDDVTFNTLIAKAGSEEKAEFWLGKMQEAGIAPDVYSYTSLMEIAPDYDRAAFWWNRMAAQGITPNDASSRVFAKKRGRAAPPADGGATQ